MRRRLIAGSRPEPEVRRAGRAEQLQRDAGDAARRQPDGARMADRADRVAARTAGHRLEHRAVAGARSAGAQGAGSEPRGTTTLGVRAAAAMCETAVSLQTTGRAPATSAAITPSSARPAVSQTGTLAARATSRASAVSSTDPVRT